MMSLTSTKSSSKTSRSRFPTEHGSARGLGAHNHSDLDRAVKKRESRMAATGEKSRRNQRSAPEARSGSERPSPAPSRRWLVGIIAGLYLLWLGYLAAVALLSSAS
jgi:hypothetical protein